jgi:transaldolase
MSAITTASPLAETVRTTDTDIWNDSCAVGELEYAIANGATGATANPTIVHDVWKADPGRWRAAVGDLAADHPAWSERELAWAIVAAMSVEGARLLVPAWEASGGRKGRLSVQTDPTLFRDADAMVEQAAGFDQLAPNVIVKFPTTSAGLRAMEEASFRGISVNATVSISVSQSIAAAEAVERGIGRREAAGLPTDAMGPVITLMMGRLEDWLRLLTERDGLVVDPDALPWAGVAAFKRAYAVFRERGFRARLLGAAIRHHRHWSELIGGDVVITMPAAWQRRFNASSIEVRPRMDEPVPAAVLDELLRVEEFRLAYEPDGLRVAAFDGWGPTRRTLRAFVGSYHDLLHEVADALIPNPDVER